MSKFPNPLAGPQASEKKNGSVRFCNSSEAAVATEDALALSPARLQNAPAGTTSRRGPLELSTDAEAVAKTDSERAVTPSNLAASGFLQYSDVTITAQELKAIRATPIELVAAPAAGSVHMYMGAILKLNYGSEVFAETADNLAVRYTDGSGVVVSVAIESTGFLDQSADTISRSIPIVDAIVAATGAEAQALVLHNTGDGEITGNASNDSTLTIRTYYVTQAL
jgi:hypothetical protein